ncbi:uncharacterized protein K460DRAFT_358448 [Cucurbitaria berberidis CBS 394.84]|uniref:Uncharacterized protein n=1 Tax=Cucurbitaria berberidis CBS 394.84 TaxID=1168544 RepID=A0A9P4GA95_9PLEO|nr:uncharacterized protein K460DRAFT_358448 [Cucurbitaria berberidis CBS 394.84]KAF1841736.1 hypothetical protein K460DRAFT_358448 [Cucurbitaria berberidis CBS 394.84]
MEVRSLGFGNTAGTLHAYADALPFTSHSDGRTTHPCSIAGSGGLHAFSDDETMLVLCVPTKPTWSLLTFDLKAKYITGSMRKLSYANLLRVFLTDIGSLESTESTSISMDWIESDTWVVDSDPVIQATTTGLTTNFQNQLKLFESAQKTLSKLTSYKYDPEVVTSPEQPVSRTTTSITFDPTKNRTFIHCFIYRPLPNVEKLPKWSQTMTMEVYSVGDPNSGRLKVYQGPDVEVAAEGYLASALHKDRLAFSFSSTHTYQASSTILCVWNLHYAEHEQDESEHCRGYVEHKLSKRYVSNLAFFTNARYLYGISQRFVVFQFDVEAGATLQRIHFSSLNCSHMCLTPRADGLDVVGQAKSGVYQVRLPTEARAKLNVRQTFAGPHIQQRYDKITLLGGSGESGIMAVVLTMHNWIRKEGSTGSNTLEPIILVSSEGDVGEWEEKDLMWRHVV